MLRCSFPAAARRIWLLLLMAAALAVVPMDGALAQSHQAASATNGHLTETGAETGAEPEAPSVNTIPPQPQGLHIYVNDYANLLSPQDKAVLQERLQALDEAGIAQVSVLILPNTDQELSDFAFQIMNQWGIQHYKKKDGLLILVNAHRVTHQLSGNRIFVATGAGLEPVLPDALVGRVLDENALPAFQQGQFSYGITQTALTLTKILAGDQELRSKYAHSSQDEDINWFAVIMLVIFILIFFNRRGGRSGGGGFYGGGGGYYGGGGFSGGGGGFSGGFGGGGDSSSGGGSGR